MKKIYYLWLRQIKKYLRSRARMVGTLAQPIIFLVMFGYGFGNSFGGGGGSYLSYLAPGIVGMSILFTSIFAGMEMIWDRQFGFLKETLVAPMSRTNVMIGRTVGAATVATIQGFIVFVISTFFGFQPVSWAAVPTAIFVMFLVALIFSSIGTIIGSLLDDMQAFTLIINFLVQPMFFLSGALFPLQGLPTWLTTISRIDPLTYGIDGLRVLLANIGHHDLTLGIDMLVLLVMALIFSSLGGYFFEQIQV
ncbi:MAG TPA: ABC transporter permease [Candidatus Paceibacterota bacterium]|nr:ABC transporter permease [Candidatus Paceibacterota bacterium]